jgi:septum formation protein
MPVISKVQPLILASGSRYRAELLRRLGLPFEQDSPDLDESRHPNEPAETLARRLAAAKARAVAARRPGRWVLGSDQVCACADRVLGKPGSRALAREQLSLLSGQEARFLTAVALAVNGELHEALDLTVVRFRRLEAAEIERYLDAEPAYDCAGSFKAEGLGISLCAAIESSDPTGLIGLPLITVHALLAKAGVSIP